MIYDSIRQAKPAIRNTFGAGRFNTRLNFYFFEINRLSFIQGKNLHHLRVTRSNHQSQVVANYLELEKLETTLFSYVFYSPTRNIK
jgi:hypothetical protein